MQSKFANKKTGPKEKEEEEEEKMNIGIITGMLLALCIVTVLAIISLHVIGLRLTHEH